MGGTTAMVFGMIGGLGLFLYGMTLTGDGLRRAAGEKMKHVLEVLTSTPLKGVIVGAVVTAVMQSSSATTVMLVSFVNAGLMTLRQTVGVIMGANIGTTVTAQLIAFNLADYAYPAIGIGFGMIMLARRKVWRSVGQVILGFGILFLGLTTMSAAVAPLRGSAVFAKAMRTLASSPVLALLTGLVMTLVIQSSAATMKSTTMMLEGSRLRDAAVLVAVLPAEAPLSLNRSMLARRPRTSRTNTEKRVRASTPRSTATIRASGSTDLVLSAEFIPL